MNLRHSLSSVVVAEVQADKGNGQQPHGKGRVQKPGIQGKANTSNTRREHRGRSQGRAPVVIAAVGNNLCPAAFGLFLQLQRSRGCGDLGSTCLRGRRSTHLPHGYKHAGLGPNANATASASVGPQQERSPTSKLSSLATAQPTTGVPIRPECIECSASLATGSGMKCWVPTRVVIGPCARHRAFRPTQKRYRIFESGAIPA